MNIKIHLFITFLKIRILQKYFRTLIVRHKSLRLCPKPIRIW